MKGELKIKFPCGYEYSSKISGLFLIGEINDRDLPICPLHGKLCLRDKVK